MSVAKASPFGAPGALRSLVAGQERAARVARTADVLLTPEEAFDAAMDLWSLCPDQLLTPPDAVRTREVEQVRRAWKTLKARFAR